MFRNSQHSRLFFFNFSKDSLYMLVYVLETNGFKPQFSAFKGTLYSR